MAGGTISITGLLVGAFLAVAVSAVTLLFGWANSSEALVSVSIGASVVCGVCLALAYSRTKTMAAAVRGARRSRR